MTEPEIKKSYWSFTLKYHPDKGIMDNEEFVKN
jgi:curved DNA-binding protein CbpA